MDAKPAGGILVSDIGWNGAAFLAMPHRSVGN